MWPEMRLAAQEIGLVRFFVFSAHLFIPFSSRGRTLPLTK